MRFGEYSGRRSLAIRKREWFRQVFKDSDFSERSVLRGSPPKVIWLRIGNCTTLRAGFVLRDAFPRIQAFVAAKESFLVLTLHP
jgi:predicted nuclease of predicted toxin-antitoxin system